MICSAGPVQNENVGSLVQKILRMLEEEQQTIKPSMRPVGLHTCPTCLGVQPGGLHLATGAPWGSSLHPAHSIMALFLGVLCNSCTTGCTCHFLLAFPGSGFDKGDGKNRKACAVRTEG